MDRNLDNYIVENYQKAMDYHYIQAFFQPVIRTLSCKLCSFEALARWVDPNIGMIFPNEFIPVLERIHAIHLLDICIIKQVCARIKYAISNDEPVIPISVNLSRLNFTLCDIFSIADDIVSEFQIPHNLIYFEITESIVAENKELMFDTVEKFRKAGYQIWMDDFGSAYSSLNILKDFFFDELKLDMGFLHPFNQRSQRIATSIIEMAKSIYIHTLAEGVETEEQFTYLRNIGCEKVQGYFFGKPLPYEQTLQHLQNKGITIEIPHDRKYYDKIGQIDLLSSVPFMSSSERDAISSAKRLNSIPLALIENTKNSFKILFYNTAFKNTASNTGMFLITLNPEILLQPIAYDFLSDKIVNLMDYTRSNTDGKMNFASNRDYYEIQAKCISKTHDKYCVMLKLSNLSKDAQASNIEHLNEFLKHIYSIFERIVLIDVENDSITPLYISTKENLLSSNYNLKNLALEFADKYIFPDDKAEFLKFLNKDDVLKQFSKTANTFFMKFFRTSIRHGQYAWKAYTILKISQDKYLLMTGNVHNIVIDFDKYTMKKHSDTFSPELLWRNLVQSGIIRLFWKDIDRRFVGASQAFLDYYGFESLNDIVGKNDEDLGWHIHPDKYMNDELKVINEGITTHNIPGWCINDGENKEILASKTPFYDENGTIKGLLGYFIDRELLTVNDVRGKDIKKRDMLTGLLNSRGINEEAYVFRDEYYLRGIDFVRIHISINNIHSINEHYGFDYGDKLLSLMGKALKKSFGRNCAVGRYAGHKFAVLHQTQNHEDAHGLRIKIKDIASSIREIDDVPVTLYLSVGFAFFSEFLDLEKQNQNAELRLLDDNK